MWIEYDGNYDKRWYDIQLEDGRVIESCYPNAGIFHDGKGNSFSGLDVVRIRGCPHPLSIDENI